MISIFQKRHPQVGARPGTLVLPEGAPPPRLNVIRYDAERIEEFESTDVTAIRAGAGPGVVTWLDVQGLGDEALLRRVGKTFDLHPLALEDLVNAPQRPKVEAYADHLLLISRMASLDQKHELTVEQVGVLVGPNYLLTFQERPGDVLDPVRRRLRDGLGPMRTLGPDYLAYAIVDTIVDAYYPVIERLSERIEQLEAQVLERPSDRVMSPINRVKIQLLLLRRAVWPQQEALNRIVREPTPFLSDATRLYFRDIYDHCAQLVDVIDSHRELVTGLVSLYLSVLGNRTNDVMKVLTIMASVFIPLTFLAGVYGMNFPNMPEFNRPWAYPAVLATMVVLAVGMLVFFRRRGWIGRQDDDSSP